MEPPAHIRPFWSAFLAETGRPPDTPLYDVFHFGDSEEAAEALLALVLGGTKRATATLEWHFEALGLRLPRSGDLSVVTDWRGDPRCVIEVTGVELRSFDLVEAGFAAAEGEGDLSLAYWRDVHWAFFGRLCAELGRERSQEMPVVCQRFRVVYPGAAM